MQPASAHGTSASSAGDGQHGESGSNDEARKPCVTGLCGGMAPQSCLVLDFAAPVGSCYPGPGRRYPATPCVRADSSSLLKRWGLLPAWQPISSDGLHKRHRATASGRLARNQVRWRDLRTRRVPATRSRTSGPGRLSLALDVFFGGACLTRNQPGRKVLVVLNPARVGCTLSHGYRHPRCDCFARSDRHCVSGSEARPVPARGPQAVATPPGVVVVTWARLCGRAG